MNKPLSPAIPPRDIISRRFFELRETCTVFEVRDEQIVKRFRRPHKLKLQGQVKMDGF